MRDTVGLDNTIRKRFSENTLKVVLTGATGWLGCAALEMLEAIYEDDLAGHVHAFSSKQQTVTLLSGRTVACRPLTEIRQLPKGRYLFLHFAFLGKERVGDMSLSSYLDLTQGIQRCVSDALLNVEVAGLILPSSGAVYRSDRSLDRDVAANPYGSMKLQDEEYFQTRAAEIAAPLVIPRIFNMSGPCMNKLGSYALSSILQDVLNNRAVHLKADHPVIRSYVDVHDILRVAFHCIWDTAPGQHQVFDTVGDREVELGELARLVLSTLNRQDLQILRPEIIPTKINRYVGDSAVFRSLLDRYSISLLPLERQISITAEDLRARGLVDP